MICIRGNPMDHDGLADDGLLDWDYAHCLPYFRKMETFAEGANEWRGGDGPMQISRCRAEHKLYGAFLHGGEQAGFALTPDHNGYKQEGLHIAQAFIYKGLRWSSARAYLYPAIQRPNLHFMKHTFVKRIVIEHGAAIVAEIAEDGNWRVITCEREVVRRTG